MRCGGRKAKLPIMVDGSIPWKTPANIRAHESISPLRKATDQEIRPSKVKAIAGFPQASHPIRVACFFATLPPSRARVDVQSFEATRIVATPQPGPP